MTKECNEERARDEDGGLEAPAPGEPEPVEPLEPVEAVEAVEPEAPEESADPEEQEPRVEEALPPLPVPEGFSSLDVLEALIFSATEALTTERLATATGQTPTQVKEELAALAVRLDEQNRPYLLQAVGRGWRLLTRPGFHAFIARLRGIKKQEGLSGAALETLAVVAYRQPIIRAEIEDIRGVQCGPMLRALLDRKLVRVAGRAQVPGRPLLYATTSTFLDRFGLKDLKDLPSLREFKEGGGPA